VTNTSSSSLFEPLFKRTLAHKKPLLMLNCLLRLLFRFGISTPPSPNSLPFQAPLPTLLLPITLPGLPTPKPAAVLFQPSFSLSNRNFCSLASRHSLSALLACSCAWLSDCCSSSMVLRSFSILSRERVRSSCSCAAPFSFRSICSWRSLTVRSTFRTDRWD
jgi:hypothetical protein